MVGGPGDRRLEGEAPGRDLAVRWTRVDPEAITGLSGGIRWAEPDGPTIVGDGLAAVLEATGPDRFTSVRRQAAALFDELEYGGPPGARPRLIGGAAFDPRHRPTGPWNEFPAAWFALPRRTVTRTADGTWLTVVAPDGGIADGDLSRVAASPAAGDGTGPPPDIAVTDVDHLVDRDDWIEQVSGALERIESTDLDKVVLAAARRVTLDRAPAVQDLLSRLGSRYADCFRFHIGPADGPAFVGVSPERLLGKRGDDLRTEALAGSAPRGETPEADRAHRQRLLEGSDGAEHDLVVESITAQLADRCDEVAVGERDVRRLPTVQHLRTPITATGTEDHALELVDALHPTPAVCGVPSELARETIRGSEAFDRGWYTGPVGWFDGAGDGSFAVGIRTALLDGRTLRLFAGNGIVAGSDPAAEWEELDLKFDAILEGLR